MIASLDHSDNPFACVATVYCEYRIAGKIGDFGESSVIR